MADTDLLAETFTQFDKDGSGSLDTSEIQNLAYALGLILDDAALKALLSEIDADASGTVDLAEFTKWFEANKGSQPGPESSIASMKLRMNLAARYYTRRAAQLIKRGKSVPVVAGVSDDFTDYQVCVTVGDELGDTDDLAADSVGLGVEVSVQRFSGEFKAMGGGDHTALVYVAIGLKEGADAEKALSSMQAGIDFLMENGPADILEMLDVTMEVAEVNGKKCIVVKVMLSEAAEEMLQKNLSEFGVIDSSLSLIGHIKFVFASAGKLGLDMTAKSLLSNMRMKFKAALNTQLDVASIAGLDEGTDTPWNQTTASIVAQALFSCPMASLALKFTSPEACLNHLKTLPKLTSLIPIPLGALEEMANQSAQTALTNFASPLLAETDLLDEIPSVEEAMEQYGLNLLEEVVEYGVLSDLGRGFGVKATTKGAKIGSLVESAIAHVKTLANDEPHGP